MNGLQLPIRRCFARRAQLGLLLASLALTRPGLAAASEQNDRCIAIVGTSDVHGALTAQAHGSGAAQVQAGGLLAFSGYLARLRARHPDRLLLLDGGDLYQGTLAANLSRGEAVIAAHNVLGYDASTFGNHDFDFGALPGGADRLGVLKARVAQAKFPFLSTNVFVRASNQRIDWPNTAPSILRTVGGIRVGIVGATTPETPRVTHPQNVAELAFPPPLPLVRAEAVRLRQAGAELVVLVAHLGGHCHRLDDPQDTRSCTRQGNEVELMALLEALPAGTVDVAIGGHTHFLMGHWVNGTATIQSGARAEHFGWIDACVAADGRLDRQRSSIHGAVPICQSSWSDGTCRAQHAPTAVAPTQFLGAPVQPLPALVTTLQPYLDRVAALAARPVGAHVPATISPRSMQQLTAEAMRRATRADFALQNAGGVRAELGAGAIRFGEVYQALPFDNTIVRVRLRGHQIAALVRLLYLRPTSSWGGPSIAGLRIDTGAQGVVVRTAKGAPLQPQQLYSLSMSDYLYFGGDGTHSVLGNLANDDVEVFDLEVRDTLIDLLLALYPAAAAGSPASSPATPTG